MGHVRDRWMQPGPNGRKIRTDRYGRGKRWQARWIDGGREKALTFRTKDAAEEHLARVEIGVLPRAGSTMVVSELAELWRAAQLHHRLSTKTTVEQTLRMMVLPTLGALQVGQVTRADVQAAVGAWAERWSTARVRVAFSHLTGMFQLAVTDGLVNASPCTGVRLPRRDGRPVQIPTDDQIAAIITRLPAWYRAMGVLAVASGMRSGELRGLTVDRIGDGWVRVDRQLVSTSGPPVWGPPKSAAGTRTIALGERAMMTLRRHLEEWPPHSDGLAFRTRHKTPVSQTKASAAWRAASDGLGLQGRHGWHHLRHYNASLLIAAGLSVRAVADRLGHADPAETLRTYAHLWPTDQTRAVAVVEDHLGTVLAA